MKRIAIIGGGIAGLSAAYFLEKGRKGGAEIEWTLFEKSNRLGGVIKTEHRDGFVLEAGPDSFLTIKPDGAQLCRDLGIGDQLISSNDADRKTYILVKGRLLPIPDGLQFMVPTRVWPMVTTPLFSWGTKLRMAVEFFSRSRTQDQEDESVAGFVRRHFGPQMVERVAEPLLAGVYGGNAGNLSVRAVLPRFVEMEREHSSLVRASLHAIRQAQDKSKDDNAGRGNSPQPLFTSLRSGVQQLVDALVSQLPAGSLRLQQESISLRRDGDHWQVGRAAGGSFDTIVLAVPAQASASLLEPIQPNLAALLKKISYTSSAAVVLAYDRAELPPGHGFLVPASEGRTMLACTFVHKKFPHRVPPGAALLRCFISSARVPNLFDYSDEALQVILQKELQEILGLTVAPRFVRVFRWDFALPQYETGHLERVAEMEKFLQELPGIYIAGNSFYGIGIPDCIRSARKAVDTITSSVLQPASV
jgi:protoporphyrinogen/coproporphyrinogen III oxidase